MHNVGPARRNMSEHLPCHNRTLATARFCKDHGPAHTVDPARTLATARDAHDGCSLGQHTQWLLSCSQASKARLVWLQR